MPFKGKMDELRIYNRALSAEEVSCSYEGKVWFNGSCPASAPNRAPAVVSMVGPVAATAGVQQTWTVKVHDPDTGRLTYDVDWGESGIAHSTEAVPSPQLTNNSQMFAHVYQTSGTFTPRVTVTDPMGLTATLASAVITVGPAPDTQAPGIPTALIAEETTATSTRIAWLAPSDNVGVTRYEVRYRNGTTFADADWATAASPPTVPSMVAAGQRVSTVLGALVANADYAVGIKACDAADNCSTIAAMQFRTGAATGEGGLLGHWKFDGNGNNDVAGGPSAVKVGHATFYPTGGKINGYAFVNSQSDFLKIPYQSAFDLPNTFTVALWFRQRADRSFLQDFVYKGTPINTYNFRIFRQLWNQNNFGPIITGYTAQRTGFWSQTSNPNQLAHNVWHHVVYTKSETGSAYYLDGALTHALDTTQYTEYAGPAKTPANDIIIGDSAVDTDFDDLRIYNRALSATEARELGGFPAADTQAPGLPTGLLAEETTATSTRVTWLAPSDNVGVTSYEVRYRTGTTFANVDWARAMATSAIPSTVAAGQRVSTVLSNLTAGTEYGVGVKACDAANNCSTIAAATFRTLGTTGSGDTTPPGPPYSPNVTAVTATTARLLWLEPTDNVAVTSYELQYRPGTSFSDAHWSTVPTVPTIPSTVSGDDMVATLVGLSANTDYAVGVKACDAAHNCSRITAMTFRTSGTLGTGDLLPTGNAGVHVTVRDPNGQSVRNALVSLNRQLTTGALSGTVDMVSGTYTLVGLASGSYDVTVAPPSDRSDLGYSVVLVTLTGGTMLEHAVSLPVRTTTDGTTGTSTTTTGTGTTTTGTGTSTNTGTGTTTSGSGTTTTTTTTTGTGTATGTTTNTGTGTTSSGGGVGGGAGTTATTTTTVGTATLRVSVRDQNNQPVSGAFVGITFPGGGVASSTMTTGADGIAVFSSVAAGTYHLGVSPPATRADLGSVANYPAALAIGSTTEVSTALPVRTQTTEGTAGTSATAAMLCGTVSDPDRNILSGITVGLSPGGGATASLGMSVTTGADGRYCFANLAPGTYVVGAMTPAVRMDLAPPGTAVVSLAAGTTGAQDLVFARASTVAPVVSGPPPLPTIERCVRDAFGVELYERMRTGRQRPTAETYARARHCFTLTVIGDTRPPPPDIGAPAIPTTTPSVIVLPGIAVPPPAIRVPEFDDRCEVRELPRVKRDLARIGRQLTAIEREVDRLRTAKVAVPTDTGLLTSRARDLLASVAKAKTCEDAFTAGEELPELMEQLRTSVDRVSRLRFAPRVLTSFDRVVKRFLDRTRASIRRLERAKFTVVGFQGRLTEADQQLKDCRTSSSAALAAIDPELFEDTMRSCFEILDEAEEVTSLTDALVNARTFLAGSVEVTLRKATRVVRDLERAKKDASDVKAFADVLRQRRDETLADVRAGRIARDELADALESVVAAFGDLDDAFEHALGTTTYDTIVGKPSAAIATPKLEKQAEEFFERE
ncbi:fibronectin type III domain-containing protein [Candidatus Uhrbacteria bacterium]|nr:fibronectin type III domain-containing protein [Candidatus Uhrbacteria bacterium]